VDCGTHLIKYTRVEACSYCHLGTVYEEADSSLLNRGRGIVTSVAFSALPRLLLCSNQQMAGNHDDKLQHAELSFVITYM
jgi:hypothetical protein